MPIYIVHNALIPIYIVHLHSIIQNIDICIAFYMVCIAYFVLMIMSIIMNKYTHVYIFY